MSAKIGVLSGVAGEDAEKGGLAFFGLGDGWFD